MAAPAVLVTGASSGIGRAVADRLAASGASVVGASRRGTGGPGWHALAMDVDDDDSVAAGVGQVVADGGLRAVVACAGWGLAGAVEQTPIADARAQLETNFFGVARVVVAALPALRARSGRVVVLGSIGGVIGLPYQAYYSAAKFALEGWAEALAWEVAPHGVQVTIVEPGNFATGFTAARRTVAPSGPQVDDPYAEGRDKALATMERDEAGGGDPAAVAAAVERVLRARRAPRRVTVGPLDERVGVLAKRLLPTRLFEAAAASSLGV
jgi:NAD(P)-dependent dehydrogenase (short-subunit alcohol dehydrogenase family)